MDLAAPKMEPRNRARMLILILAIALELAIAAFLWVRAKPHVLFGFLVKNGREYVLAWKDDLNGYSSQSYGTLNDALRYAKGNLKLEAGVNPIAEHELEHVWLQDRFGTFVVLWKTIRVGLLNQMTFQRQADALFFAEAFRRGSYTPSPFGHSVLLMPQASR